MPGYSSNKDVQAVQRIKQALLSACTKEDREKIARVLIDGAKMGDIQFIREFYDRTVGKPTQTAEVQLTARFARMSVEEREQAMGKLLSDIRSALAVQQQQQLEEETQFIDIKPSPPRELE